MAETKTYMGATYTRSGPGESWSRVDAPATAVSSTAPVPIFTAPADPAKAAAEARATTSDARAARDQELQEAAARRTELEWNATHNPDGTKKAGPDEGKPVPAWAEKTYSGQIDQFGGINRGLSTFKDEYAGNAITGGLENTIQGAFSGFGSEGQRDWWAQFGSTDNVIRNDLFGAALTDSEKAAYAATSVNPSMDPKEVRKNLQSRRDILSAALKRRTNFMKAQGYSKDAIEALAGEYAQELGAAVVAPDSPPVPGETNTVVPQADPLGVASDDGSGEIITPEDREFKKQADELLAAGGVRADFDALAAKFGRPAFDESLDRALETRKRGLPQAGFQITPSGRKEASTFGALSSSPVGSYFGGALDTMSSGFADEIAPALGGDTGQVRLGMDAMRRNNPIASGLGSLTGGAIIPIGRGASTVRELAGIGGGLGALYGVGSGDTMAERIEGGVTGGLAGAALGAGIGKLGDIWRRGGRGGGPGGGSSPTPGPEGLDEVAARLGIRPSPATVGGRSSEAAQIGLGNAPGSMGPVRAGVEAEIEGLADAARDTASRMGVVTTPQQAGEIVARGARVADRAQARAAGRQYDARTSMMGGESAPVTMGGSQTAIANIANDFRSNEVVGELLTHPLVRRLETADAGELTLGEATELLSEARRVIRAADGRQPGRLVSQLRNVERAIEADVNRAAQASDAIAGRAADQGAVAAQREGDRLWADRMTAQKQELKRALGSFKDDVNTSGESVYRQMFQDMREEGGNLVRLRRTLDRLPRQARDTFAATAFDDFGRATPGAQNAAGDAWSFETFMTNWGKASDEAKRAAFGGRGVDREINDIVRYADRLRTLNKARNFSNTGATAANASYATALAGSLLGGPGAFGSVAAVYPAMNVAGRAFMATPALRSWLRSAMQSAVRGNSAQARTLVRRLPALAAKNPALSAEIGQFERAILAAMNDNRPMSAAASDDDE